MVRILGVPLWLNERAASDIFSGWTLPKDAENLERCRKSNSVWLRALMQSDCLYSSLFFEHYYRILLFDWVIELRSVRLIDGVSSHNAFACYLDLVQFKNERPTP